MKLTPLEEWIIYRTGIMRGTIGNLENYQLNKIKETLNYVKKNSRFYKEYLKDVNVSNINSLEDFKKIPFTSPHHLKKDSISFLCVPQKDISRIVTLRSSGTSGEEKRIYFTEGDLQLTIDFFKHGMSCLVNKDDKVLVLLPGNSYGSIGDLLKKALEQIQVECYVQGVLTDSKNTAEFIQNKNINCIVGIPIQLLYLSRVEGKIFKNRIEKVLLSTDYVPEILVREFTNKFRCKVFNHYGMTEMGYGGGVECEALNGYHMREADLYFEIINPMTGKDVEPGQVGEIVFTTLTREGMPLIRYRTGDIASFSSESCLCGTFLKTINRVKGRIENRIKIDEDKFIYMWELDEIVLSFEEVLDYEVCIKDRNIVFLELVVENKDDYFKLKNEVKSCIQKMLDIKCGNKSNIEFILKQKKKTLNITNSMVKRKINDFRTE